MDEDAMFGKMEYFNDDGTKVNPDLIPVPPMCLSCKSYEKGGETRVLCTLNRMDQADEDQFRCGQYEAVEW